MNHHVVISLEEMITEEIIKRQNRRKFRQILSKIHDHFADIAAGITTAHSPRSDELRLEMSKELVNTENCLPLSIYNACSDFEHIQSSTTLYLRDLAERSFMRDIPETISILHECLMTIAIQDAENDRAGEGRMVSARSIAILAAFLTALGCIVAYLYYFLSQESTA